MDGPLIAAGALAVVAAGVHGGAGEVFVVRQLSIEALPRTRLGSPRMTMAMIHVSWHITTVAFLVLGAALLAAALALEGDAAHAVAVMGAASATGFAAVMLSLGAAHMRSPRFLVRHLGPVAMVGIAALAWWGAV